MSKNKEELIQLNVGGRIFGCYKSTLLTYPETLLARMFSTSASIAKKGNSGEYFFDRNPDVFEIILEFYRTKRIIAPKSIPLERIKEELEYFGINFDVDDIEIEGERNSVIESFLSFNNLIKNIPEKGYVLGHIIGCKLADDMMESVFDIDGTGEENDILETNAIKEQAKKALQSMFAGRKPLLNEIPSNALLLNLIPKNVEEKKLFLLFEEFHKILMSSFQPPI